MPFDRGRVSFCRFKVDGDAPAAADEAALGILTEHAFRESDIGVPEEVEAGFITGDHLYDTQFTYEKNGFGDCLHFALRLDTNRVPSEVKQAYRRINELAAAQASPTGFANKREKREAKELASRQMDEELASGKYRRSKMVPVLWDLSTQTLYLAASSNAAIEQVVRLMREAFAVELQLLSAGALAGRWLREHGFGREYEDARPSVFTSPPDRAARHADDADGPRDLSIPDTPWCANAIDQKDFLGNEFLIWLWWLDETQEGTVRTADNGRPGGELMIIFDKVLEMECAWGAQGKQGLRADGPTRLAEAASALQTGKWPRKAGLMISDGANQFELTLQADRMLVSGAVLPEPEEAQHPREIVEHRLRQTRELAAGLDGMFATFLKQRAGADWSNTREQLRAWVQAKGKAARLSPRDVEVTV